MQEAEENEMDNVLHVEAKKQREPVSTGLYWLRCFVLLFLVAGLVYIRYPLSGTILFMGEESGNALITQWFARQYAAGRLPVWSAESAAGIPIASYMQGAFFLPSIVMAFLPLPWFTWLNYTLCVSFGACFFGSFLAELNVKRWIATVMSFVMLFSIHLGSGRGRIAGIEGLAICPFVFFEFQRYLNTHRRSAIVLAGMGTGAMLLAATPSPQLAVYMMVVLFVYVLVESIRQRRSAKDMAIDAALYLLVCGGTGAAQMLPGFTVLKRYAAMETGLAVPPDYLAPLSVHPAKLLLMFFPNIFYNNVPPALEGMNASGFEMALFLGTLMAPAFLFGLLRYRGDGRVRLMGWLALGVLVYAALGQASFLASIVYRLPVLKELRNPSRSLYLFILLEMAIVATVASRLSGDSRGLRAFSRFLCAYSAAIGLLWCAAYLSSLKAVLQRIGDFNSDGGAVALRGLLPVALYCALTLVCERFSRGEKYVLRRQSIIVLLAAIVFVDAVAETFPISTAAGYSAPADALELSDEMRRITADADAGKLVEARAPQDPPTEAGYNLQMRTGIPTLNANLWYNNPNLCAITGQNGDGTFARYNSPGALRAFSALPELLRQNDVLSMLGVKYIADRAGILSGDFQTPVAGEDEQPVFEAASAAIPATAGEYGSVVFELPIEAGAFYRISFEAQTQAAPEMFYADLYGFDDGLAYDNPEQETSIRIIPGSHRYTACLYSGSGPIPSYTCLRLICSENAEIQLKDIRVDRLEAADGVYVRALASASGTGGEAGDDAPTVVATHPLAEIAECPESYALFSLDMQVKPSRLYQITFELETAEAPEAFFVDLYGYTDSVVYDDNAQQAEIAVAPNAHSYTAFIYSGDGEIPENTALRFVSVNGKAAVLRGVEVVERQEAVGDPDKQPRSCMNTLWVNSRARDILHAVNRLRAIGDIREIEACPAAYDFADTSYMMGIADQDLVDAATVITDAGWQSDHRFKATVSADRDIFVNFAQSYDPDWHAYVDGEEVFNNQVNLAIQGVFVSAGTHELIYDYRPVKLYWGLGASAATFLLCLFILAKGRAGKRAHRLGPGES